MSAAPTPAPGGESRPGRCSRRLLFPALFALLALAAGLAAHRWAWSRPVGDGPAGPAVPAAPFQQVWTSRPVLLVGMGDSVTAGFGASPGLSYFDRLVRNPAEDAADLRGICLSAALPNLRHTNLAVSGSTSLHHARHQLPRLPLQPANVLGLVVLTTGGNDLIHDYGRTPPAEGAMFGATFDQAEPWIAAFRQRLEHMLEGLRAGFPGGVHVFLANIYDPTDGVGDIQRAGLPAWPDGLRILNAYNRVLADVSAERPWVHPVNLHDTFLGHGIHCVQFWRSHYSPADPHYWYHANLEDPNDRGYDAIRRLFLNAMAGALPHELQKDPTAP
jgi:lysophospholipase L1-like esterase